mgnify:CR=1 FL=1
MYRFKAIIDTESKWNKDTKKVDINKKTVIKTVVFKVVKGVAIKQTIKSLDDIRNLVRYGCTFQMQLNLIGTYFSKNTLGIESKFFI